MVLAAFRQINHFRIVAAVFLDISLIQSLAAAVAAVACSTAMLSQLLRAPRILSWSAILAAHLPHLAAALLAVITGIVHVGVLVAAFRGHTLRRSLGALVVLAALMPGVGFGHVNGWAAAAVVALLGTPVMAVLAQIIV